MKSDEFKKILKPLIRQTIKEVLLEDGVLSKVVSEVAHGLQHSTLVETKQHISKREENARKEEILEEQRQERIRRLNEATNLKADVFKGTKELANLGESNSHSPMTNVSPQDSGVDITEIQKLANGKWKALIGG